MKIAVITGASSGMGQEFARQLKNQEKFDEVWVIARREERLLALKEELQIPMRILPMDLTKKESFGAYKALLEKERPTISLLVNASGFGRFGRYDAISIEDSLEMIDLNCKALVAMTELSLPYMEKGGRILQVDSLSAFQPVPLLNVYGSTKAFVLNYSKALCAELKSRGIHVMAFCPGWVMTEFFDRAEAEEKKVITYFNRVFSAEEVVRCALKDLKKKKGVCVPGWQNKLQVLAVKFLPSSLVLKVWMKQQKFD